MKNITATMYPTTGTLLKACSNTLGRVMNISDGPLSGRTPTEAAAGKIIIPASMATRKSITLIWIADDASLVWRLK